MKVKEAVASLQRQDPEADAVVAVHTATKGYAVALCPIVDIMRA